MSTKLKEVKQNILSTVKNAKLTVIEGVNKGKKYKIGGKIVSIGRSPENDIVLISTKISKNHAKIEIQENKIALIDLGSSNGTYVNGKRISKVFLNKDDTIIFGRATKIVISGDFEHCESEPLEGTIGNLLADAKDLEETNVLTSLPEEQQVPTSKKKRNNLKIVLIIILLGGISWLGIDYWNDLRNNNLTSTNKGQSVISGVKGVSPYKNLNTEEKVNFSRINSSKVALKKSQREADKIFKKAYHTYLSNRFNDSIKLFKEVLLFDKNHILAQTYVERAKMQLRDLIDLHDRQGRELFESLRFQQAMVEFRAVINLLADNRIDPRYADAKRYIKMAESNLRR